MKEKLIQIITDEGRRRRLQYLTAFAILGCVATVMTVMNILTHKGVLTWATGCFAVLCAVNFIIMRRSPLGTAAEQNEYAESRVSHIVSSVFGVEVMSLFTFFLMSGIPDGFSAIWLVMLPACGMLIFGRKRATVLCMVMLLIMLFFFWTEPGRACTGYEYSLTFRMRFPILYAACFVLSTLLEFIREATQKQLNLLRDKYEYLAAHDCLTNLLNRQGLLQERKRTAAAEEQAVFMVDIDLFKVVNDSFGHDVGDAVLARVGRIASEIEGAYACRWGGEEFVVWFPDARRMCDPEWFRRAVSESAVQIPHSDKTVHVTVSIGVARGCGDLTELIARSDKALYRAKEGGRDRVECA